MKLLDTLNRILKPHGMYIKQSRVTDTDYATEYIYIIIKYKT